MAVVWMILVSVCPILIVTVTGVSGQPQSKDTIRLVNGSHPWEGRLELQVNGTWGPFCDLFWGPEEAEVACRQLGFNTSHVKAYKGSFFGKGSLPNIWLDRYLRCSGGEVTLDDCIVEPSTSCKRLYRDVAGVSCDTTQETDDCVNHQCLHGGSCHDQNRYYTCQCKQGYTGPRCETDIDECGLFGNPCENGATCADHPAHYTCTCPPEFTGHNCEVNNVPGHGSIRLVNGTHPGEGRVEILVEGVWGAICDSGWDDTNAKVVCRQLGYNTSAVEGYRAAFFGWEKIDKTWTTHVECTGNESRLVDCKARAFDSQSNACRPTRTAGVSCDTTQDTDDCANHRCQNGARCYDRHRGYYCSCRRGYSGTFCEIGVRISVSAFTDRREDSSTSFYCNSGFIPSRVAWFIVTSAGKTLELGTCTSMNNCSSPYAPDVTVTWPREERSYVTFESVKREFGGQVFCNFTHDGLEESNNTTLNVYNPGKVENRSVEIGRHNWSFVMGCDVTSVYSSAGIYDFGVDQGFNVRIGVRTRYARGYVFEGRLPYGDVLAPYVDDTDGRMYYRGRVMYSWPIASTPGAYPDFRFVQYYGYSDFQGFHVTDEHSVAAPSKPTHNCSDLNYIPETGVVPCVCTADSLGSPAGRLLWLLGNITIATGDYGVEQLMFPSGEVGREHDGMMAVCLLDWIDRSSVPITKHVAYGPDNISLNVIKSRDESNNLHVHIISHVIGMKPMEPGMVQWGGLCQGQQGFTCTLTPRSAAEVDGKAVTCRVTNADNNGHSAVASVVIRLRDFLAHAEEEKMIGNMQKPEADSDHFKHAAIGLGIALGVIIIVFIVVIIILYRHRHLYGRLSYDMKNRHTSSSFKRRSDLDMHSIVKGETHEEHEGGQSNGSHVNPVAQTNSMEVTEEHI